VDNASWQLRVPYSSAGDVRRCWCWLKVLEVGRQWKVYGSMCCHREGNRGERVMNNGEKGKQLYHTHFESHFLG
jgi:hypothetical protein